MEINLFLPEGRISRPSFWVRFLLIHVITFFVWYIMSKDPSSKYFYIFIIILLSLFSFIQCVKRMHDFGKSGWFILIPFYNLIIFFEEGTKGSNAYGESLKESNAHAVSAKGNVIENKDLLGKLVFSLFVTCGVYALFTILNIPIPDIPGMISRVGEWLIIQFAK